MSTLLNLGFSTIVDYIISALTIISSISVIYERFKKFPNPDKTKLDTFKRQNIIARKKIIDQIQRGNTYTSSFFKQINPFDLRIPLKSVRYRILPALFTLPLAIIAVILFNVIFYNNLGIAYIPIVPLDYSFLFAFYSIEDDFTVFNLKKNWSDYPFTALKRTISAIIFVIEQTINLIVFVLIVFFLLLLIIGPINTLTVVSQNIYSGIVIIVLLIGLSILVIWKELNVKNDLIIWAFSKFIKEENAQVNLIVGLREEIVSGCLIGIGNNMELDLENTYHREIPWSSVVSVTVDKNIKCTKSKKEPIDDFFFRLKGKSIEIANYYRVEDDLSISTTPELIEYIVEDWLIINASGQRVLELITKIRGSEFKGEVLSMNSFTDLVFIDSQNSKSYKIINMDLKNLNVEYTEV